MTTNIDRRWYSIRNSEKLNATVLTKNLRAFLGHVNLEFCDQFKRVRIAGPDTSHLLVDQDLVLGDSILLKGLTHFEIFEYKKEIRDGIFLCFEDSWTFLLIQKILARSKSRNTSILHVDAHDDLRMPLISRDAGKYINVPLGTTFSPKDPTSINEAILSGAIGIGNFLTPLYFFLDDLSIVQFAPERVPFSASVILSESKNNLLPDIQFIDVKFDRNSARVGNKSYTLTNNLLDCEKKFSKHINICHIDLDFFINTYDGGNYKSLNSENFEKTAATIKIVELFSQMKNLSFDFDYWLIATSPGFCRARHWKWLLDELLRQINLLRTQR